MNLPSAPSSVICDFFDLFDYDPVNGGLVYRKSSTRTKPGQRVSTPAVVVQDVAYSQARIIWAMHNLKIPGRVYIQDGDTSNLKIENIKTSPPMRSTLQAYKHLVSSVLILVRENPEVIGATHSQLSEFAGRDWGEVDWNRVELGLRIKPSKFLHGQHRSARHVCGVANLKLCPTGESGFRQYRPFVAQVFWERAPKWFTEA